MACNQVLYHLDERAIEGAVLPWCAAHSVAVTAYSPLGHRQFPSPDSVKGRLLQKIADAHHATPRQVALQFLLQHDQVVVIPKASTVAHIEKKTAVAELQLNPTDIET